MSGYYTRALKARDPRYKRVLEKLGHAPEEEPVQAVDEPDEMADLRAEYKEKFGKKPFGGWDAETIREKLEDE